MNVKQRPLPRSPKISYFIFSENIKKKLYGALILPIAVRESKTFVSQIRGKIQARVVREWGAEEILYPKENAVTEEQRNCILNSCMIFTLHQIFLGHAVAQLVDALHYKPADHGVDSRWRHWNFSLT